MSEEITTEVEQEEVKLDLMPHLLPIITIPNKSLTNISDVVEEDEFGTDELNQIIVDMLFTAKHYNAVGLAAPQVGVNKRIVVLLLEKPMILINPMVLVTDGEQTFNEGCLSVPGYFADIVRAEKVRIVHQSSDGTHIELAAEGMSAVCIQHEIDHLNGKLFIDDLSILKKASAKRKVTKYVKQNPSYVTGDV